VLLICPKRPGYGRSDPASRGHSFAVSVGDLEELLEELGVADFIVSGVSTGGGFALAAAAAMGDRVLMKPNVAVAAHRMVPGSRLRWVEGGDHFMLVAHPELLLDEVTPAGQ